MMARAFQIADLTLMGPVENKIYSIAVDYNNVKWFGHKTESISQLENTEWSAVMYNNEDILGGQNCCRYFKQ